MDHPEPESRYVIGCMTGTSLDALDAVLTKIVGRGLDMTAQYLGMVSVPLPDELRSVLLSMANDEPHPAIEFMRAARYLGVVHAQACATLIQQHPEAEVDFIVPHGQTVWHAPADALSWQLFDPWPIVRALQVPVCYDLRQADLVAGGQGAPLMPLADLILFGHPDRGRILINLGGVCSFSEVQGRQWHSGFIDGFDLCPCNLLLDGLVSRLFAGKRYDDDGHLAAKGKINPKFDQILGEMLSIRGSSSWTEGDSIRSLGREDIDGEFLHRLSCRAAELMSPHDVLASAVEYIFRQIENAVVAIEGSDDVVLAGGGTKHAVLRQRLCKQPLAGQPAGGRVLLSDELGIPAEAREAMGFAVLGALSADGVPITLPAVTGSETPGVAGTWAYPDGPGDRV